MSISWQLEEFFDIHLQVPFAHLEELACGAARKDYEHEENIDMKGKVKKICIPYIPC